MSDPYSPTPYSPQRMTLNSGHTLAMGWMTEVSKHVVCVWVKEDDEQRWTNSYALGESVTAWSADARGGAAWSQTTTQPQSLTGLGVRRETSVLSLLVIVIMTTTSLAAWLLLIRCVNEHTAILGKTAVHNIQAYITSQSAHELRPETAATTATHKHQNLQQQDHMWTTVSILILRHCWF